ncbi:hypothetical protein [Natrinema sp. CGMCC1.2065]|uniref:hypothetical protein n=1 Tax=Natrinema sp. CGMCC1.2065 TaxID=3445767 RepID=UPI003F4A2809
MRATTSIVLFWIWFSASAALLEATGIAKAMGVSTSLGAGEGLQTAVNGLNTIESGGVSAESIVGLTTIGTGAIQTFVGGLSAGPRIMINVGLPAEIVVFLHAPVGLLAGRMIIYGLAQREL